MTRDSSPKRALPLGLIFLYTVSMSHQKEDEHKKSRGRPAGTDLTETIPVRLNYDLASRLDAWVMQNGVSRSQAISHLVELGLSRATAGRARKSVTSSKSSQLAETQIDKMIDKSASAEEQETRKRRLLKGPSEFRDVRKDRKNKP